MHPTLKSVGLTLLLLGSTVIALCVPTNIGRSPVLAQSTPTQDRKAEADRLFDQGTKQLEQNQNEAAIASFQKALMIYRELKERQKEGRTLKSIGNVYYISKDYPKAIKFQQQALAIAREIKDPDLEGRALNNLGNAYKELENTIKAIKLYQQSLSIAKAHDNYKLMQITLGNLGNLYRKQGESVEAIQYYQQLASITKAVKDERSQAATLSIIGDIYSNNLKEYQAAVEYYQQGLKIAEKIQDPNLQLDAILNIANISFSFATSQASYQNVIELARQGLTIAQNIQAPDEESRALAILGNAYNSLKDYQEAIKYYQQSVVAAKKAKNELREAVVLNAITDVYLYRLNKYTDAITYAQQSLLIAKRIKNPSLEATALSLLGKSSNLSGHSQKAIEYHLEALAIDQEIKNRDAEARDFLDLSLSYYSSRNYQKSSESSLRGLKIAKEVKNQYLEALALTNLGVNAQALNDYQEGIRYSQQALEIYREIKDYDSELLSLHNLNSDYIFLGDYQKVKEHSQQILDLGDKINNREYKGTALAFLGFAYFAQGDLQTAIHYGQQALADGQETKNSRSKCFALLVLSTIYSSSGNYNKALELAQQSLIIAREPEFRQIHNLEGLALNIIGTLYRKSGQEEKAIAIYRESLRNNTTDSAALAGLARVYSRLNQPITAISYYKQALSEVEQTRRKISNLPQQLQSSFLKAIQPGGDQAEIADIYRELADLLLSQGRILEAQQVLELLKIQEVQDFTRSSKGVPAGEVAFAPRERQLSDKSNSLIAFGKRVYECQQSNCPQLDQLLDKRQTLSDEFDQQVQIVEKEFRDRNTRNLDDATLAPKDFLGQAEAIVTAQPGTVLIYPLVMENRIWLLWASRGVIVKRQEVKGVGQKHLSETVLKFRQLLQNPNSDLEELKATGKQLYDWLIQPIESELKANDIHNLVFSLDRSTRYIPMAALFDGEKFLLERYAVSTVLSAGYTDMSHSQPLATQSTQVLALGLSEAKPGFNPLPNVPAELNAIVQQGSNDNQGIYPGRELLNNTFSFSALRRYLGNYRIVHIATHGQFVPVNPDESFLLLGDGNPLKIPRIRTLQNLRNIDLIVLSACETALGGADRDGVEIAGISSYFLQRGKAKAVMASLWSVSDASTSLLMQQFYKNLATGTMSKAEALRQAQLSLLERKVTIKDLSKRGPILIPKGGTQSPHSQSDNFPHPYYWAPFILIGNGL